MDTEVKLTELLTQRAAEWKEKLKSGERSDHLAFITWLRDSKLHVAAYLEMEALDRQIQALGAADRPAIEQILATATPHVREIGKLAVPRVPSRKRWQRGWSVAVAATALLFVGLAMIGYYQLTNDRYTTSVGERRSLKLPDGSTVDMNVDTKIQVHFDNHNRHIELISGEAAFNVAHHDVRPFIVRTSSATVRAIGTQFNIYQRRATVVSVLEGQVQVATSSAKVLEGLVATNLRAGEELQVANGKIEKRERVDVAKVVAWRQGRLYLDDMPLEDIVREFNRHGGPVRLTLDGVAPGTYKFGGTFNADDPMSLADILEQQNDLSLERRPDEIVIRPRKQGTHPEATRFEGSPNEPSQAGGQP